jgi:nitrate reductase (cytochrome), electron transfer subunit
MRRENRGGMRGMTMKTIFALWFSGLILAASAQVGDRHPTGLRGSAPLDKEAAAPLMAKMINDDIRKGRAFAMQPPVIPYQIENYQVDKNHNKCMTCHGRNRVPESQAPMVSVTHFMDRDSNFRSEITPSRYFCVQCHVPQMDVKPPVENTFVDAERAVATKKAAKK